MSPESGHSPGKSSWTGQVSQSGNGGIARRSQIWKLDLTSRRTHLVLGDGPLSSAAYFSNGVNELASRLD
jgi:hypothetical protein